LVADVAFRGRGYEHAVELADGTQLTGVFSERRVPRGERVGLRLEASGCLVFPGATPGPARPAPPVAGAHAGA
jgi:iron(III) transport system ATP-binding protein